MAKKKVSEEEIVSEKEVVTEKETKKKAASKTTAKATTKTAAKAATKTTEKSASKTTKKTTKKETKPVVEEQVEATQEVKVEAPVAEKPTQEAEEVLEYTIAQKLLSLYNLQQIYSKIDKIRIIRGELPEEIQDLEDAHEGMSTRIANYKEDIDNLQTKIKEQEAKIKEAQALIKRYTEQQDNVRNNREYESLTKEIDYQNLEIQVLEKHKNKFAAEITTKQEEIQTFEAKLAEIAEILESKKNELSVIVAETEKEEAELVEQAEAWKVKIEPRLLAAFERIRKNARNGLAIVQIERDACGGCFSTIPPQRQLDIRLHKKIIVCEACGRIFIDHQLVESQNESAE
jgi:predicted  nucleic acid-binding Zn-ribbon protein